LGVHKGAGVIWNGTPFERLVIPAKAGIHAPTIALPLCTSPSGLKLLGANESSLLLDSRFGGNDCAWERPCLANDTSRHKGLQFPRFRINCNCSGFSVSEN
jgi:hypothetical protein